MKSTTETLSPTRVKLTIEVPFEEFKPSLDKAYKTIGSQITIPGFRKGKVPAAIVDQRIGRSAVLDEAINGALPGWYNEALQQAEIQPLSQPEIDLTKFVDGEDIEITAELDVRPTLELPDLASIEVQVADAEVTDADVDEQIDALRDRFAVTTDVDRAAADGDAVTIDLVARAKDGSDIEGADAKGLPYTIGSGTLLDGLDADVRERLVRGKRMEQAAEARDLVLDEIVGKVEAPLPDAVVAEELQGRREQIQQQLSYAGISFETYLEDEGQTEEEFEAELERRVRDSIVAQFVLDQVVADSEIGIQDDELSQHIFRRAQESGQDPNSYIQHIMEHNHVPEMVSEVLRGKALAELMQQAVVKDASGTVLELGKLRADGSLADDEESEELHALDATSRSGPGTSPGRGCAHEVRLLRGGRVPVVHPAPRPVRRAAGRPADRRGRPDATGRGRQRAHCPRPAAGPDAGARRGPGPPARRRRSADPPRGARRRARPVARDRRPAGPAARRGRGAGPGRGRGGRARTAAAARRPGGPSHPARWSPGAGAAPRWPGRPDAHRRRLRRASARGRRHPGPTGGAGRHAGVDPAATGGAGRDRAHPVDLRGRAPPRRGSPRGPRRSAAAQPTPSARRRDPGRNPGVSDRLPPVTPDS
ncbi:trigger factor, partial [Aeromicrobium sp. REDSEA-S32_B7]|uniref:trigger factor n=1 Tax=Aeromicrobium sp. REDSEA-S32_B7 TaxID=1811526 RepID=UPI0029558511